MGTIATDVQCIRKHGVIVKVLQDLSKTGEFLSF